MNRLSDFIFDRSMFSYSMIEIDKAASSLPHPPAETSWQRRITLIANIASILFGAVSFLRGDLFGFLSFVVIEISLLVGLQNASLFPIAARLNSEVSHLREQLGRLEGISNSLDSTSTRLEGVSGSFDTTSSKLKREVDRLSALLNFGSQKTNLQIES